MKQHRIETAEDLFLAMRSPELGLAISTLQSIAASPEAALAFGTLHGLDVVDELIRQSQQRSGITYRKMVLGALANFNDPRAVTHLKKILLVEESPELVELAMTRLAREPLDEIESAVKPLLMQERSPIHTHAAATLLLRSTSLTAKERLRVTLANAEGKDVGPELNSEKVSLLLSELTGWFAPQARELVERRGEDAYLLVRDRWVQLSPTDRSWLLRLGVREHPHLVMEPIRFALMETDRDALVEALLAVQSLGAGGRLFAKLLTPLTSHADPVVRAETLRAGASVDDLARFLDDDPRVVCAACGRLAEAGAGAISSLLPLLGHDSYEVRGAAAEAMVAIGAAATPHLRPLVQGESMVVAVAATSALMRLGDQEWLEENLIAVA